MKQDLIETSEASGLLRLATAGSVDDGKSTLIGRLLYDSRRIYEDHLSALRKDSAKRGSAGDEPDLALLLDGLRAEREQTITIDVAYRYFSMPRRKFIIADTPGHEQYTRNMATGASTADLAVILIDARNGVTTQTRRHSFIMSLLGVRHLVAAVNKMDLAGYSHEVFESIRDDFAAFAARLNISDIHFIPISSLKGDNVVYPGANMPWYHGVSLLEHLETVHIVSDRNLVDLRFPVQYVIRPNQDFRGYAGTVASGILRQGSEVMVLPSGKISRVSTIMTAGGKRPEAFPPMAVVATLKDDIDVSRGDFLVHPNNVPAVTNALEAMVIWMDDEPLVPGKQYLIKHTTAMVRGTVECLRYRVNVDTLHREEASSLNLNEIGRAAVRLTRPLFVDPYERNRATGAFIFIDPVTNATAGAGMVIDRKPSELILTGKPGKAVHGEDIGGHVSAIGLDERIGRLNQKPVTVWLTGLPCSGKSTIAYALEKRLFESGYSAHVLDGGNLRRSISRDLGFSADDRLENVRRAAGVAKLTNDLGLIAIAALVSPYASIREQAKEIIGADRFIEVYLNTPREICEQRDTNGLYEKARRGEIAHFTGVSAPYEPPEKPDLVIPAELGIDTAVDRIIEELQARGSIGKKK